MDDRSVTQRRYARYDADLEVAVHQDDLVLGGRIIQISRGGCLIYPALPMELKPQVEVSFHLSGDFPSINCDGEIIYNIAEKGTGVTLTGISESQQDLITQYFDARLAAQKQAKS